MKMKELTVISGKGGTGKTTLVAAFASLANDAVLADCDVDAADLHLLLDPKVNQTIEFFGLKVARIDEGKCTECGECHNHCRFDAITEDIEVIPSSCEGCGVCEHVCPTDAIELVDRMAGYAFNSETRFGPMAHARLNTAEEASGMLVTLVRNNAKKLAKENSKDMIIIDGPPGIGCPVISAITGVDLVLIVTEPTLSGIHDLKRILGVSEHFSIPALVCVNKYDVNLDNTKEIERYCSERNVGLVGRLPYDDVATAAMIEEKSVIEFSDCELSQGIISMWKKIQEALK